MLNTLESTEPCQILVEDLFAMINKRRKMLRLEPVENRAMASRCTLRFNLGQQRGIDFSNEKISVTTTDLQALRDMVNNQFGVNFENELITLAAKSKAKAAAAHMVTPRDPIPEPEVGQKEELFVEKSGFGSRLKRLFGGR